MMRTVSSSLVTSLAALASVGLVALLAACGGKAAPAGTVGNASTAASVVPAGVHACQFIVDGQAYGPHRCDVTPGATLKLDKVSGMEQFSATLAESPDGLTLTGEIACTDMTTGCHQAFTAVLKKEADAWRGAVTAVGGAADWWLAGATFELTDAAGYGGATYGDAWPQPED